MIVLYLNVYLEIFQYNKVNDDKKEKYLLKQSLCNIYGSI